MVDPTDVFSLLRMMSSSVSEGTDWDLFHISYTKAVWDNLFTFISYIIIALRLMTTALFPS